MIRCHKQVTNVSESTGKGGEKTIKNDIDYILFCSDVKKFIHEKSINKNI